MTIEELACGAGRGGMASRLRHLFASLTGRLGVGGDIGPVQKAALAAFTIRVAGAAIAYLSQVLLARWMGSFEYGIFVFVWVWVLVLGSLAPLGLSTAVIRLIPEYGARGDMALLRGLLLGSRLVTVAVSSGLALTGLLGLVLFGHLITPHFLIPATLILFCLPLYSLVDVQDGIARAYSWTTVALLPPYILRPLLLLAVMLIAGTAGLEMDAVTAAGAAILSAWLAALWQLMALRRRLRRTVAAGPRGYAFAPWLALALPILLVNGFTLLLQNTDILILSAYVSPSDVAVYFAALKTMGLIGFVHFAIGTATAHRFSGLNAAGDTAALRDFIRRAVAWTFWPSLVATLAILALGWPLLRLFGGEFTAGYPVMFVLALGVLARAAVGPAEYVLNMLGEQNRCAAVLSAAAALNIGLNVLLIPAWGLVGAAAATSVSIAAASLLLLLVARRRLGLTLLVSPRRHPQG